MLRRCQARNQRRVDARSENGVVLRAAPTGAGGTSAASGGRRLRSICRCKTLADQAATAQAAPALAQAAALASDFSETNAAASRVPSAPAFDAFDIDAFNDALLIADAN
jgi:hypothetical protein